MNALRNYCAKKNINGNSSKFLINFFQEHFFSSTIFEVNFPVHVLLQYIPVLVVTLGVLFKRMKTSMRSNGMEILGMYLTGINI